MRRTLLAATAALAMIFLGTTAWAEKILVLSGGDSTTNAAVSSVLSATGNSVTIGPTFTSFTGAGLSGYNDVILMPNGGGSYVGTTFTMGTMPTSGQQALVNFVSGGGGLVTAEATMSIFANGQLSTLGAALPVVPYNIDTNNSPVVLGVTTPNSVIDAHLPSTFAININYTPANNLTSLETEGFYPPKPGATGYFTTNQWTSNPFGQTPPPAGAVGWNYGLGRVFSLSMPINATALANLNFDQLVTNAVNWAAQNGTSPPVIPPVWGANPPIDPAPIPEPATLMMWGVALAGALALRQIKEVKTH